MKMKRLLYKLLNLFLHKTGHSDLGTLYSYEEFNQYIDWDVIVEDQGIAFYADNKHEYSKVSDIFDLNPRFTHIMWYDK